jgi:hypothetical protein
MGRYYFNVRREDVIFEDHSGVVLDGLVDAWEWAIKDALVLIRGGYLDPLNHRY